VKTLEANGGTELLQPLKHILDSHQDQSILLITDGEISNTGKYFISLSLSLLFFLVTFLSVSSFSNSRICQNTEFQNYFIDVSIFLLPDEVIRMVYEKRHLARVFTLGIGYGVSHHVSNCRNVS
jgi:hypothetical protein